MKENSEMSRQMWEQSRELKRWVNMSMKCMIRAEYRTKKRYTVLSTLR